MSAMAALPLHILLITIFGSLLHPGARDMMAASLPFPVPPAQSSAQPAPQLLPRIDASGVNPTALNESAGPGLFSAPDTQYTTGNLLATMAGGHLIMEFPGVEYTSERGYLTAHHSTNGAFYMYNLALSELYEIDREGTVQFLRAFPEFARPEPGATQTGLLWKPLSQLATDSTGRHLYMIPDHFGLVYRLDLQSMHLDTLGHPDLRSMKVGYNTQMYGEGRLFAFGGYGYWTRWNKLFHFDPVSGLWDEVEVHGEKPETFVFSSGRLYFDSEENRFLVFVMQDSPNALGFDHVLVRVHALDLTTRTWSLHSLHLLPRVPFLNPFDLGWVFSSDHGNVDVANGLVGLDENLLFDVKRNRMIISTIANDRTLRDTPYTVRYQHAVHYSKAHEGWISLVQHHNLMASMGVTLKRMPYDEMRAHGRRVTVFEYHVRRHVTDPDMETAGWAVSLLLGLTWTGAAGWNTLRRRRMDTGRLNGKGIVGRDGNASDGMADEPRHRVETWIGIGVEASGSVRAKVGNTAIPIPDSAFRELLRLLHRMKRENRQEILLQEADAFLFPKQANAQISRNRSKLIGTFNSIIGHQLIQVVPNRTDKRFRDLSVDLDRIENLTPR